MNYTMKDLNDNKINVGTEFYNRNMFIVSEFSMSSNAVKSYSFKYDLINDAVNVSWNSAIKNVENYFYGLNLVNFINKLNIGRALYIAKIYMDYNFIRDVIDALDYLRFDIKNIKDVSKIKEKANIFISTKYSKYLGTWNKLFLLPNSQPAIKKYVSEIVEEIKTMKSVDVTSISAPAKEQIAELEKVESNEDNNEDNTELKHVDPVEMKEIVVECGSFEYAIRKAYEDLVSTINNFLNNEDNSSTFTYRNKDDVFIVDRLNNGIVGNYFIVRQMQVHEFNEGEKDVRQIASKIFPEENKEGLVTYLSEMIIGRTNVSFVSNMPKYSMFTQ